MVATTVGPYVRFGEPLVAACARAGTDYADLTGEPEFVDRMYVRHHAAAVATGARIVHACGFDSIPHDLGVLFTVQQLPEGVPLTVRGFVRASGRPSAGTFHSAVTGFSRLRQAGTAHLRAAAHGAAPAAPRVLGQGRRALRALARRLGAAAADDRPAGRQALGRRRSSATGPTSPTATTRPSSSCPVALGAVGGVGALFALSQLPPTRSWLLGRMQSGDGPSPERRERSWFKVRFVGEGGGRRVVTEVAGGDPGYDETAKMLAESALCLATDEPAAERGPGHHRRRDGRRADRAPAPARHHVRAARVELRPGSSPRSARP